MASPAQSIAPLVPAIEAGRPALNEATPRIVTLDVFRGLTLAAMILVNNPGDWQHVYWPLAHAEWNGWTLADLVFPFFLFIVGVAIPLALGDAKSRSRSSASPLARIVRRSAILFGLGLLLNAFAGFESLAMLRIPGVLPRIGLCYLAASLVYLYAGPRAQAAVLVALLAGYWVLLVDVPVSGRLPGVLDPERNLVAAFDRRVLGEGHLFHHTWDPEGLLSTFPAIATTLGGVLAGNWLRSRRPASLGAGGFVAAGGVAAAAGTLMALWLPINKSLWTSSYVVFTTGLALVLFGAVYWLVDVRGVRRPLTPFVVFGVNSIAVYVLSTAVAELFDQPLVGSENLRASICRVMLGVVGSPEAASLGYAAAYVLAWLAVMSVLYRRKIFIKI